MKDRWLGFYSHAFLQVLAAALFIFVTMYALDVFFENKMLWVVGITSLASSAFLVFCAPRSRSGSPKRIVFGYVISLGIGLLTNLALDVLCRHCKLGDTMLFNILIASMALAFTLLLMVLFAVAHPPAAGAVLAVVMQHNHSVRNACIILLAAVLLALIRWIFDACLVDLVRRTPELK